MKKFHLTLGLTLFLSCAAYAGDGMVRLESAHDVATTADRLESALNAKGMTVFVRVDHAAGATKAGMQLNPTQLVVFGNPKIGTPLMLCTRATGIDLPQKALIWEDDQGKVWLGYNDPQYLVNRHSISGCDSVIAKMTKALGNFARAATQP